MFLISVCFLTILVLGIMLFLDVYFQRFYKYEKISEIIDSMNTFVSDYQQEDWNDEALYARTKVYAMENNVILGISRTNESVEDEENHNESSGSLLITVKLNEKLYDFFLPTEGFGSTTFEIGDIITIEGYIQNNGLIDVTKLNQIDLESEDASSDRVTFVNSEAVITNVQSSSRYGSEDEESNENSVVDGESKTVNGVTYSINKVNNTSYEELRFTKVVGNNELITYFNVSASLKSVNDVVKTVRKFIPYFIVFSLAFAYVIAFIYSKLIAKPILRISSTADQYAKMNFNERIDISRKDELGVLSNSLNILADNLSASMSDLKDANEQLKKDYEREVKQEQARKEFVANASHELKSPLGIIRSYSEGLRDGVCKGSEELYLDFITEEIENMDHLIHELLKLSKYDSMAFEINSKKEDLLLLINDSIQGYEKQLYNRQLKIQMIGEFGMCYFDFEKIKSALSNLISNAVKYADEKSVITVQCEDAHDHTLVKIINVCEPFSEDELTHVWNRFYRIDSSYNPEKKGTGLGLSIVKSIFDAHELDYGVMNTTTGVCFWFKLLKA